MKKLIAAALLLSLAIILVAEAYSTYMTRRIVQELEIRIEDISIRHAILRGAKYKLTKEMLLEKQDLMKLTQLYIDMRDSKSLCEALHSSHGYLRALGRLS